METKDILLEAQRLAFKELEKSGMEAENIYTFLWADPSEIYASIALRISSSDKESARKEALRMLAEDLYGCDIKDVEWKIERDAYFGAVEVWKNF